MRLGTAFAIMALLAFGMPQAGHATDNVGTASFVLAQAEGGDADSRPVEIRERRVSHMEEMLQRRQERSALPDGVQETDWTNIEGMTLEEREARVDNALRRGGDRSPE